MTSTASLSLGPARAELELVVAAGLDHPRLHARAPYDLVIANILAAPLIELAPAIANVMEAGGRLVLAGLLDQLPVRRLLLRRLVR